MIFTERKRKRLKKIASQRVKHFDPFTDDPVYEKREDGLVKLVHEIYESGTKYPIVTHTFAGKTREEAQQYFNAHLETDKFFKAMEKSGKFGDIKGRTRTTWSRKD